ncbi:MAG: DEAD/DEAH box helicase [Bacteroidales bacterium]|nr:DEAD/DEAH box helicase [Bacteroidales bacterium]
MPFSKMGLSPELLKAVAEQNYTSLYPIQEKAIPEILSGKDIVAISKTGSGKTASYVLPVLEKFHKHFETSKNRHVQTLVIAPTRELAMQIDSEFVKLGKYLPQKRKSLAVYGGVSINPQMINLQGIEILIATPGRLIELIESNAVSLSEVKILVIDEADKMLSMGFRNELENIFKTISKKKQTLLYSATLTDDLEAFDKALLINPILIKIDATEDDTECNFNAIEQTAYLIDEEKKGPLLRYLIFKNDIKQVLVFTSSVHRADAVVTKLRANGIDAMAMHSKKSQGARNNAFEYFKAGKIQVLVATDLMARGIDIPMLPYVINYELPRSPKDYVHRIGRTGRAGNKGEAISFINAEEEHHFKIIQKKMGRWATMVNGNELELNINI